MALSDTRLIEWRRPEALSAGSGAGGSGEVASVPRLREAVGGFERNLLKSALSRGVERTEVARMLGISRQALHQKIVRYGL